MFGRKNKKDSNSKATTSSERTKTESAQEIKTCGACGATITDTQATHCSKCGALLPTTPKFDEGKKCPKCKSVIDASATFCSVCGCNVARAHKQATQPRRKRKIDKELKRIAGEESVLCANDLTGFKYLFEDGIAETEEGVFSYTMEFGDVSYEDEREDQQDIIFDRLSILHHSFQQGQTYQLNLVNVPHTKKSIERYLPETGVNSDMASAYNDLIEQRQREGKVEFTRKNYITFATCAPSYDDAKTPIRSMRESTERNLTRIGSKPHSLDGAARAQVIHDLIAGAGQKLNIDTERLKRTNKAHVRDYVAPAWAVYPQEERVLRRYIQMPGVFVKTLHIKDVGADIQDNALRTIRALPVAMNISLLFQPQQKAKMTLQVRQNIDNVQAEMLEYSKAVGKSGGDPSMYPPALEDKEADGRELMEFMRDHDQQIAWFQGFITIYAKTADELERSVSLVIDECTAWTFDVVELPTQQEEALMSALPLATSRLTKKYRSLSNAESAALVPFASQNVSNDPKHSYYIGVNSVTGEDILANPDDCKSPHMWVFGMTGSGKGMMMNAIISYLMLQHPRDTVDEFTGKYVCASQYAPELHIMDWHDEYWELGDMFGASVSQFGPGHHSCINVMNISNTQGELREVDVASASDTFIAILESCMKDRSLTNAEITKLDATLRRAFKPYFGTDDRPDLATLYKLLKEDDSRESQNLAAALGSFVEGSFNCFAGQTNVVNNKQMNVYRMSELGENMQTLAVLAVLQHVRQRAYANFRCGRQTYLIFEECQIVFDNEPAMKVLVQFFSQMRKFGLKIICVTQLPDQVLEHSKAKHLFDNSGLFIFLPQQPNNQDTISSMFKFSQTQYERLDSQAPEGTGMCIVDGLKIGFDNRIPRNNMLFKLWNTDPDKYAKKLEKENKEKR